jgi:hypothetical protein
MKSRRRFTVVIERDEGGFYVASVPALKGCHTQARSLDTLMKRVREVVLSASVPDYFSASTTRSKSSSDLYSMTILPLPL